MFIIIKVTRNSNGDSGFIRKSNSKTWTSLVKASRTWNTKAAAERYIKKEQTNRWIGWTMEAIEVDSYHFDE